MGGRIKKDVVKCNHFFTLKNDFFLLVCNTAV